MISVTVCRVYPIRNLSILLNTSALFAASSSSTSFWKIIDGEWWISSLSFLIFFLALLGNLAALLVMFGSRGPIRLTNNKYLVNLACADLLRTSFMPFTTLARMKKNFMFGPIICKILPIVQGLSVAVDVFTLVCISVERYIAICRPLLILKLQSLRFGNLFNALILFCIWFLALLTALPNLLMYNLCSLPTLGRFKCEKVHPKSFDERIYMISLDIFYFLLPILIMVVLYAMIICKMYKNNTAMKMRSFHQTQPSKTISNSSSPTLVRRSLVPTRPRTLSDYHQYDSVDSRVSHPSICEAMIEQKQRKKSSCDLRLNSSWPKNVNHRSLTRQRTRSSASSRLPPTRDSQSRRNSNRSHSSSHPSGLYRVDRHRRKALKLLIVIIVEFFVCWTPLFIYHTLGTFNKRFYRSMPSILVDLILLFSFASPLCNPLTYYFMSKRYRSVLFAHFSCLNWKTKLYRKNEEAMQVVKALRRHQEQNSTEYKLKTPSPASLQTAPSKARSNTLY